MKTKHIILLAGAAALLIAGVVLNMWLQSPPAAPSAPKPKQEKEGNIVMLSSGPKKYFDDPAIVVTDTTGKTYPFHSIKGKVLFFRFRNTDRTTDLGAEIARLKQFAQTGKHYKSIALLVSLANSQSVDSLKKAYQIPFAIYGIDQSQIQHVPLEKVPLPYYFVQEEDKRITHLSVPASQEATQVDKYLQSLELPVD
jgi:hypothetical protein